MNLVNTASAPMQGASTKTFLFTFVVSHKTFPELEFLAVPPVKLCNGRLLLYYGCCPAYRRISSVSFCSLHVLLFAPKTLFSKPDSRWSCVVLCNRKHKWGYQMCCSTNNNQFLTTRDTRNHAPSFKIFFWWEGGKGERTWWMSMFLETSKVSHLTAGL